MYGMAPLYPEFTDVFLCGVKFHSITYLHIQEGDVVVVVELRVEAADGAILARDREQPVERIREEHVVKVEVL